jgi:hypothetical protein
MQKLNQGLSETLRRDSTIPRRPSDDSTIVRFPSMPLLNSAAPDGVHRHSIDTNWPGPDPRDGQISPTSTVPSLIPDDEGHGIDMVLGSPPDPSSNPSSNNHQNAFTAVNDEGHGTDMVLGSPSDTHQNAFTAVNNSWVHPTHGHDHDEVLPLARTGKDDDVFQVLLSLEDRRNMEHEVADDGTPGPRCAYMVDNGKICNLPDPQGRKVISQIFGRNKASTRAIGDGMYIMWCRKHYQRARYRQNTLRNYGTVQCNLLIGVLQRMIDSRAVDSFTIALRLREHERRHWAGEVIPPSTKPRTFKPKVEAERDPNMRAAPKIQHIPVPDYMLRFCGENRTFDDVKAMIGELRANNTREEPGIGKGPQICIYSWPDIELLPNINPSWNPVAVEDDDDDDNDDNDDDDDTLDEDDEAGNPDEGSSAGKKRKRAAGKDDAPSAKKSKTASASTKSTRGGKGKSKAAATSSEDVASSLAAEILASMSKSPPAAPRMSTR